MRGLRVCVLPDFDDRHVVSPLRDEHIETPVARLGTACIRQLAQRIDHGVDVRGNHVDVRQHVYRTGADLPMGTGQEIAMDTSIRRTVEQRRQARGKALRLGRAGVPVESCRVRPSFEDREMIRPPDSPQGLFLSIP